MADDIHTRHRLIADFFKDVGLPAYAGTDAAGKTGTVAGANRLYAGTHAGLAAALFGMKDSRGQTLLKRWEDESDAISAIIGASAAGVASVDGSRVTPLVYTNEGLRGARTFTKHDILPPVNGNITLVELPARYIRAGASPSPAPGFTLSVNVAIAKRLMDALDVIQLKYPQVKVNEGYRSYAYQLVLYENYQAKKAGRKLPHPGSGNIAAHPARGNHRKGHAVDLDYMYEPTIRSFVVPIMLNVGGLTAYGPGDLPHFSLSGG